MPMELLQPHTVGNNPLVLTPEERAEFARNVSDGMSVRAAYEALGVRRHIYQNTIKHFPEFAAEVDELKAVRAAALLELAEHETSNAAGSKLAADIAKQLTNAATQLAEKLAPREYGALVKVGADPTLGPAVVQVVSFAPMPKPATDTLTNGDEKEPA